MDLKPLFVFPRWSNTVTLLVLLFLAVFPLYAVAFVGFALDPVTLNVGYMPTQPVPYSHKLHVGELGLDCRYCHNTVEKADFAAIPPTETCMNCHRAVWPESEKLAPVRQSFGAGKPDDVIKPGQPVPWRQVTTVPDYVYFNHSAHVNSGISCVECHGQINQMETVYQAKPMNMGWCIQCHRDPTDRIRPREAVTKLDWQPSADDPSTLGVLAGLSPEEWNKHVGSVNDPSLKLAAGDKSTPADRIKLAHDYVAARIKADSVNAVRHELGEILKAQYHVNPNTDCITCHR